MTGEQGSDFSKEVVSGCHDGWGEQRLFEKGKFLNFTGARAFDFFEGV